MHRCNSSLADRISPEESDFVAHPPEKPNCPVHSAAAIARRLRRQGGGSGGFLPTGTTAGTGSGTTGGGNSGTTAAAKLNGIAATGAAFAGAKVTVVDQRGVTVCTTETDAKGAYECTLPADTKAPLVVTAARDDLTLYSTTASATGGNVNVRR